MSERKQLRLGLIGYGEVGSTLGKGLREQGLASIASYDKYAFDGPFSALIQNRARDAGVELVASPEALAARVDLIIGVTPGAACLESAEAFNRHLGPRHVFVDIASATPKVKQGVAERLRSSGARVADGSIMGSPHTDGYRIPILASGPAAQPFHELMAPWGMQIEPLESALGTASGIKILRSVIAKGLEALLVEFALGARRYGIDEVVLKSWGNFADQRPFVEIANFLLVTDAIHAERRAEEAAMSAEALEEIGIEPIMTRSTAKRLQWVADLGMKDHFGGVVPKHYSEAIDAIEAKLAAAASARKISTQSD